MLPDSKAKCERALAAMRARGVAAAIRYALRHMDGLGLFLSIRDWIGVSAGVGA